MRERTATRFQESNLHARLIRRIVMGQVVIDHEEVTRTFAEGTGRIELVAIYEVRDGKFARAEMFHQDTAAILAFLERATEASQVATA